MCCDERSNPLRVSVQELTEFPVYLFDEKGNNARAIKRISLSYKFDYIL